MDIVKAIQGLGLLSHAPVRYPSRAGALFSGNARHNRPTRRIPGELQGLESSACAICRACGAGLRSLSARACRAWAEARNRAEPVPPAARPAEPGLQQPHRAACHRAADCRGPQQPQRPVGCCGTISAAPPCAAAEAGTQVRPCHRNPRPLQTARSLRGHAPRWQRRKPNQPAPASSPCAARHRRSRHRCSLPQSEARNQRPQSVGQSVYQIAPPCSAQDGQ